MQMKVFCFLVDLDPIPSFADESKGDYLTYDNITWKLKIRKEVRCSPIVVL